MGNLLQSVRPTAGGVTDLTLKNMVQPCAEAVRNPSVQVGVPTHVLAPEIQLHIDRLMKDHAELWSKLA